LLSVDQTKWWLTMADEVLKRGPNSANASGAITNITEEVRNLRVDEITGGLLTSGAGGGIPSDGDLVLKGEYYQRFLPYLHASGRIKYGCKNTNIGAALADTDWECWKYSDADIPTIEGPRTATGGVATEGAIDALSWVT